MSTLFEFPNPVNETSSRVVAFGVVAMGILYAATGWGWVLVPLTYGFVARVLTGPTLSPLGRLAVHVVTPRLPIEHSFSAGPPKRFAQGIGLLFSVSASVLFLFDAEAASRAVVGVLVVAAALEAFLGFCLGCWVFARLMRLGVIPDSVCEECNNISARISAAR
ncbi:MAG: hypothetical protein RLY50_262 [Actinomycetota bacterium]|jgi:hypothetical protein